MFEDPTDNDIFVIRKMLGRPPRGLLKIAGRCKCGNPIIAIVTHTLDDGTPFPTTFYLVLPALVKAVSTLEAEHYMEEMNDHILDYDLETAHKNYIESRIQICKNTDNPHLENISAGGMPTHIKCLHSLIGQTVACGKGANLAGDEVMSKLNELKMWSFEKCSCKIKYDEWGD
ncbi:MAG: DUF501 domain-containing protein [Bifidobacteriaceae bacterium]|jgi:hypothetical protein|nr:DUF501 domain-containing protein [Bifidobacteriaceae bacterium]